MKRALVAALLLVATGGSAWGRQPRTPLRDLRDPFVAGTTTLRDLKDPFARSDEPPLDDPAFDVEPSWRMPSPLEELRVPQFLASTPDLLVPRRWQ